jgi:hypothetical protein
MKNQSIKYPCNWEENGLKFHEIVRQEYGGNNCIIRGGFVEGENKPPVDTIFLRLEKDGIKPITLLLRPDEMQAIAWVASGTIWSYLMDNKEPDSEKSGS